MSDEQTLVGAPEEAQTPWNPPAADLDFDALFGGAGDGSSDIVQVEEARSTVAPIETATEPEPQVVEPAPAPPQATQPTQTTLRQDPDTGFFVATYKTKDAAEAAITEKNQLIENLRKMVSAVTGQDPLKKGANQPQAEVSYLQDANRYAQDKERAAQFGQRTGDWRHYRDVEAKLQLELIQQTVGQYAPVVKRSLQQEALDRVSKDIPEFKALYGTDQYTKVLEARPALKQSIEYWEQQGDPNGQLSELYKSAWDTHQALRLPELLKQPQPSNPTNPPRMPMSNGTLTAPRVVTERGPQTAAPTLNSSAGRKALIADMEARGILDRHI